MLIMEICSLCNECLQFSLVHIDRCPKTYHQSDHEDTMAAFREIEMKKWPSRVDLPNSYPQRLLRSKTYGRYTINTKFPFPPEMNKNKKNKNKKNNHCTK